MQTNLSLNSNDSSRKPEEELALKRRIAHIISRAWSDELFKQKLINEPAAVFSEYAIDNPAGVNIKVVENTSDTMYFVLPPKPSDISHVQLDRLQIQPRDTPCHGHEPCSGCDCVVNCQGCVPPCVGCYR